MKQFKKKTEKHCEEETENYSVQSFLSTRPEDCKEYSIAEYNVSSDSDLKTSTPMKVKNLKKIIILHEVSDLKIYEDFDDINMFDVSAVTFYEEFEERELSLDDSGFKIYENIGESFAVD